MNTFTFQLIPDLEIRNNGAMKETNVIRKGLLVAFPPLASLAGLLYCGPTLSPPLKLLWATLGMLYPLKLSAFFNTRDRNRVSPLGLFYFFTIWPGMSLEPFKETRGEIPGAATKFVYGWLQFWAGALLLVAVGVFRNSVPSAVVPWIAVASFLFMIHFGIAGVITSIVQLSGFPVAPLFSSPLKSATFSDFWSHRWNRPFVEMNKGLFLPPLQKLLGAKASLFALFLVSAVLHELAISYPAGGGWGKPLAYFAIQGVLFLLVTKPPRFAVWLGILGPLALLFTPEFRAAFLLPVVNGLNQFAWTHEAKWYLACGLWLAGVGHFVVLTAALQVPFRLNWKVELKKLTGLNRKLMWVYGAYISFFVTSFGVLTLYLRDRMIEGDPAALCFAIFIAVFWTGRLFIDAFFFEHKDWPEGPQFVIGHCLLTTLFVFLAANYSMVALWHWWY